jgi:hypothetical protein
MPGPRPPEWELISETCVRVDAKLHAGYRAHWLDVFEQNAFNLSIRHRTVTVAYPGTRGCGRDGCAVRPDKISVDTASR